MRRATIMFVRTPDTRFPTGVSEDGRRVTLEKIFAEAGITLLVRRHKRSFDGGVKTFNLEQLHRFMREISPSRGRWQATILLVPRIEYQAGNVDHRPLGVMFDSGAGNYDGPEREGCAVAYDSAESDSMLLRTVAHELGHVFNLRHTPGPGHSLMHTTGNVRRASGTFPTNIRYMFEDSDRQWLAHGDEELVRPGGKNFLGAIIPTDIDEQFEFEVSSRGRDFQPGEPLRLRYSLRNTDEQSRVLDGLPTLATMRAEIEARSPGFGRYRVSPPVYVCEDDDGPLVLEPGGTLKWGELLPADARLDVLGEHELHVRMALDTDRGLRVLAATFRFSRRRG